MKSFIIFISLTVLVFGCAAQELVPEPQRSPVANPGIEEQEVEDVTDEVLQNFYRKYPVVRKQLKAERPDLFQVVNVEKVYDSVIYILSDGERYFGAVFTDDNIWTIYDMGDRLNNCVQDSVGGDTFRVFSVYGNGTVPAHIKPAEIKKAIKKYNQ